MTKKVTIREVLPLAGDHEKHFGTALERMIKATGETSFSVRNKIGCGKNYLGNASKDPYPPPRWGIYESALKEKYPKQADLVPWADDDWPERPKKQKAPSHPLLATTQTQEEPELGQQFRPGPSILPSKDEPLSFTQQTEELDRQTGLLFDESPFFDEARAVEWLSHLKDIRDFQIGFEISDLRDAIKSCKEKLRDSLNGIPDSSTAVVKERERLLSRLPILKQREAEATECLSHLRSLIIQSQAKLCEFQETKRAELDALTLRALHG